MIFGFKDGVIAEQGTHDELMSKDGIYKTLVTHQVTEVTFTHVTSTLTICRVKSLENMNFLESYYFNVNKNAKKIEL